MSANVSVRAEIAGFDEAKAKIAELSGAVTQAAENDKTWAQIQADLNAAGAQYRTELDARAKATQDLKDHTAELVKQFQAQQATEEAVRSGMVQGAGVIGDYAMRVGASVLSIGALIEAFRAVTTAGLASIEQETRLGAVLEATGGSVGKTKDQLIGLAGALAASTRFDHTQIEQATAVLLTFGNVQGDVFSHTIKAAMDLSETFGMDLSSAARYLGRALDEPTQGFGLLGRFIGQLSPVQKQMIKDFNDSGDAIGAQNALLQILDNRMKGVAETMGNSVPGEVAKAKNAWNDLLETLGKTSVIGTVASTMTDMLTTLREGIESYGAFRLQNEIDVLTEITKDESKSASARADAARQLDVIYADLGAKNVVRKQQEADAVAAAAEKTAQREAEAETALGAANAKFIEDDQKKQQTADEQSRKLDLDLFDYRQKLGRVDLTEKLDIIDQQMKAEGLSADEYIKLMNLRADTADKIGKQILAGQAAGAKQEEEVENEKQRQLLHDAEDQISAIKRTTFSHDELIAKLDALRAQYVLDGNDGTLAFDKITRAMNLQIATAPTLSTAIDKAIGEVGFSVNDVVKTAYGKWVDDVDQLLMRHATLGDTVKKMARDMGDAIIHELARVAVNESLLALKKFFDGGDASTDWVSTFFGSISSGFGSITSLFSGGGSSTGGGGSAATVVGATASGGSSSGGSSSGAAVAAGGATAASGSGAAAAGGSSTGAAGGSAGGSSGAAAGGSWMTVLGYAGIAMAVFDIIDKYGNSRGGNPQDRWNEIEARGNADPNFKAEFLSVWPYSPENPNRIHDDVTLRSLLLNMSDADAHEIYPIDVYDVVGGPPWSGGAPVEQAAVGTDSIFTSSSLLRVGEAGPERVTVSPLAGAAHNRSTGAQVNFNGPVVMDYYTMRKFTRDLQRYQA